MPSSVSVGWRPSMPTISSNSSRVRPWRSRTASDDMSGVMRTDSRRRARPRAAGARRVNQLHRRLQHHQAVGAAHGQLARPLGMRHQADHVARLVAQAGDVGHRSVRVAVGGLTPRGVDVAEQHLAVALEPRHHVRLGVVVAFAVRDRNAQHLALAARRGERRVGVLDPHVHVLAAEVQAVVAQHRAGQQPGLEQHLEAVADPEHRAAGVGKAPRRRP